MLGPDNISHSSEGEKELDIDFSTSIIDWISNDDLTFCVGEGFVLILILDFLFNFKLQPFMREGDRYLCDVKFSKITK